IPSGIDPLLQGFTQSAAQIVDPNIQVNPLNNWFFTSASSVLIILLGWFLTDKVVEPRLQKTPLDGDIEDLPAMDKLNARDKKAFWTANLVMILFLIGLFFWAYPEGSALRAEDGEITSFSA